MKDASYNLLIRLPFDPPYLQISIRTMNLFAIIPFCGSEPDKFSFKLGETKIKQLFSIWLGDSLVL